MAETIKNHFIRQRIIYMCSLLLIAGAIGITFSLFQVRNASAAVTEITVLDSMSMIGKVKAGATVNLAEILLTASAGETLSSIKFTIANVAGGATSTDFQKVILNKINNSTNDVTLVTSTTVPITVDTEMTLNAGANSISPAFRYALALQMSTSSVDGRQFRLVLDSGTDTYLLSAGTVNAAGLTGTAITIDNVAPTGIGGGPTTGSTNMPIFVFINRSFSERLLSTTVNTTTVSLQTNTGNTQNGAPTGSNLCNSVALATTTVVADTIQCEHMADAIPLTTSTWYTFTISTSTTDMAGNALATAVTSTFQTGDFNASINTTPPNITESNPSPGFQNFSINGNLAASLAFPNMSVSGAGSITSTENVLLQTASFGQPTGSNICLSGGCALSWSSDTKTLTINPTANLTASTDYILTLKKTITNSGGIALNGGTTDHIVNFRTASGVDSTAPTITQTQPAHGATNVELNKQAMSVFFSENMDPSTINSSTVFAFIDVNTNAVYDAGVDLNMLSENLANLLYDQAQQTVFLGFKSLLTTSTQFCAAIIGGASGVKDTVGLPVAVSANKCFVTTAQAFSAIAPTLMFADADNFRMWIQFDRPVNPTDAVDKTKYSVEVPVNTQINLATVDVIYRPEANAVEMTGLGVSSAGSPQFKVTVTGVRDISGTQTIVANGTTNVAQGIIQSSDQTGGFVGGFEKPDFSQTNFATFWEKPERCSPRTIITSVTTTFECEFPSPASLAVGSTFILTIPAGFGVGSAAIISTSTSFMNKDINGPGANTTWLTTIATNTTANTITLTTGGGTIASGDHIKFELSGIVNSSAAGEKSVSIVIKDGSGVKQGGTITTAPFMLGVGGVRTISGKVCKGASSTSTCGGSDTAVSGAKIFCDSFGGFGSTATMSGHQETTSDNSGNWTISNLSDGEYGCGIMPDPTVLNEMSGGSDFKKVFMSEGNKTGVDFRFTDLSSTGKSLTVNITSGVALANEQLDVFCHAGSFDFNFSAPIMKLVTLDGSGAGSATIKLQPGKTYECGVGPHMDFSSMTNGGPPPVPDFKFMPPKSTQVVVPSATNPDAITFALTIAGNSITGTVTDGTTGIGNVFVHAAPMGCFDATSGVGKDCFGGFAQTKSNGTFTLNVSPGVYEVGADAPGMPPSEPVSITVTTDGTVLKNGTAVGGDGLTLKMIKSSVTIAGVIKDESGSGIKYAHVSGEKIADAGTCSSFTPVGGFRDSPTDSSGNYTLYVSNGTWRVVAFSPSYGQVGCKVVTVSGGTSQSGQDIQASASSFKTISGTAKAGAFISAFGANGGNNTQADNSGTYSLKVTAGIYTMDCFAHGVGPCGFQENVNASSADQTVNFGATVDTGTVSVTITGISDAFVDVRNSSGRGSGSGQGNAGLYTITVPTGTYTVRAGGPKYGELCAGQTVTVTSGQTSSVTCSPPSTLRTVAGRITDGTNNMAGATVKFINNTTKESFIMTTDAQGSSSNNLSATNVPDGTYTIVSSKQGYEPGSTTATVLGGNLTLSSPITMIQATGANGTFVSTTVQADGSNYAGSAKVIATKSGKTVVADIDKTTGIASLPLTNGAWTVKAVGDNGKQSAETTVTVATGSLSGSAPTLSLSTSITGFSAVNESKTISPKTGGLFTADNVSGLEVNIPGSTLHTTDSNTGKVEIKTDPTIAAIDPGEGLAMVGATGYDITPKDSNGNPLGKTLYGDAVTITIPYTDADVTTAGVDETKLTVASLNANGEFETFPTVVDTTNNLLVAQVTHFSSFGVVGGTATVAATPASPSPSGGGSSPITATTAPTVPKVVSSTESKTIDQAVEVSKATSIVMGASSHTVTVSSATADVATVSIASTPVTTTIKKGETKDVDTNADGYANIQVSYYGLDTNGKAVFRFVTISDEGERSGPMTINDGQYSSALTSVLLSITATGATEMMISSSSAFTGAKYIPYTATSTWILSTGNGIKTVYVKLKSASAGTVTISDTITLTGQGIEQKEPEEPKTKSKVQVTCSLEIGKAYKTQNSPTVYYISKPFGAGTVCVKRPFSKAEIFFTYFSTWTEVKTISQASLDAIAKDSLGFMPLGPKYSPKYGALIKSVDSPQVYLLVDGKRRWIDSENTFMSFGYSWDWIEDVHEDLITNVSDGGAITKDTGYPSGLLIKYAGNPKVYLLAPHQTKSGKLMKKHVKDMQTFDTLGYRWDRIVTVPSSVSFDDGEQLVNTPTVKGVKVSAGHTFTLNLSAGSSGAEVKALQLKLQNLGYLSKDVNVTGYYGPATTQAVRKFQTAQGIQALGIVGPSTRNALNSL
ncbi:MAG: Ig-like domain-containing protein [Candidatus Magasanikbacteria bacterium]|nr:Ig-like domain-containing protein [Candidatus Magasanikbacteria bacterium]